MTLRGFAGLGATHTTIHERTWLPFVPERCAAARRRSRESPTITDSDGTAGSDPLPASMRRHRPWRTTFQVLH